MIRPLVIAIALLAALIPSAVRANPYYGPPSPSDRIHFRVRDDVRLIALSPNSSTLATLTSQKLLRVINTDDGEVIGSEELSETTAEAMAYAPDGNTLLIGSSDQFGGKTIGELVVYNIAAHKITHLVLATPSPITCVAYAHSGKWFVTGTEDAQVCFWDPAHFRIVKKIPAPKPDDSTTAPPTTAAITISPDDSLVAVSDNGFMRLIDSASGAVLARKPMDVVSASYAGVGRTLAVSLWYADSDDISVAAIRLLTPPALGMVKSVRVAPLSGWYLHTLSAVPGLPLVAGVTNQGFAVYSALNGKLISELYTDQIIRSVSFSSDGGWFAYIDINGAVNILPTMTLLSGKVFPPK